jgi:hypothetical protein
VSKSPPEQCEHFKRSVIAMNGGAADLEERIAERFEAG